MIDRYLPAAGDLGAPGTNCGDDFRDCGDASADRAY
jgi:hypothetical protein